MQDFTESAAYLHCPQPMPVGSALQIQVADDLEIDLRVEHVHEQVAGSEKPAGMLVGATGLEGRALQWWSSHVGAVSGQAARPDESEADAPDTEVMDVASPEDLAAAEAASEASAPVAAAPEPGNAVEEDVAVAAPTEDESAGSQGKKRKRRKRR